MRGRRSRSGSRTTTKNVRTAACSTVPQRSSQRRLRASTEMKWGKRPQTPAPCPTPPSPLQRKAWGANRNRRKSHYPWTKDGGQVTLLMAVDPATDSSADASKLIALENAWNQAQLHHDAKAVSNLVSDGF